MKIDSAAVVIVLIGLAAGGIRLYRIRQRHAKQEARVQRTVADKEHPILGKYGLGRAGWWCHPHSEVLGYSVSLGGAGEAPTEAQIERWEEIQRRLPQLLKDSIPPPGDDGWGHFLPDFDSAQAEALTVKIREDLGFSVLCHVPREGEYHALPNICFNKDWSVRSAEWSI